MTRAAPRGREFVVWGEECLKTLAEPRIAAEVRSRLRQITAADQGRWGVMTAHEAVCHLREAFTMAFDEDRFPEQPEPLPRLVIKFLALRMLARWPKGRPTVPGLGREDLVMNSFREDQANLLRGFDRFLGSGEASAAHPIFGCMSRWDWMRWGYLHTDHHLRQFGR